VGLLSVARRGALAVVTVLGQSRTPLPGGRPTARLLAADDDAAAELAAGILRLLGSLRGPWALRLTGLPLGDPTLRFLADALPASVLANTRSRRLVDDLDTPPGCPPLRSRDARALDRWLPALLEREPDRRVHRFLRSAARLHAATDQLELAVAADGDVLHAGLLTLVDGADRWPWWGTPRAEGLRTEMGAPLVSLTARGGWQLPQLPVPDVSVLPGRRAAGVSDGPGPRPPSGRRPSARCRRPA
jgi:hypothetical protein